MAVFRWVMVVAPVKVMGLLIQMAVASYYAANYAPIKFAFIAKHFAALAVTAFPQPALGPHVCNIH